MQIIHQHMMFLGAYFSIILGIGQFVQKDKPFAGYIYGISFISMGLWIFHVCSYSTGIFNNVYIINLLLIPFGFISAPIMTLRYQWLINQTKITERRLIIYLIPAVISFCVMLYPVFDRTIIIRAEYLQGIPILSADYLKLPVYFRIVHLFYLLPKVYLVAFMLFKLKFLAGFWKVRKGSKNVVMRAGYIFAFDSIFSTFLTAIGDLYSTSIITWAILYCNVNFYVLFIFGQRNPEYNRVIKTEIVKSRYEKSKIKYLDIESILSNLHDIMENQKAFASEDITIKIIADELGITVHQLSEILNEKIKKNFNSFINDYRIDEAKKLLIAEPGRTITSVALAVGFNSNTAFSTIFSRTTGITPKEYRIKMSKCGKTAFPVKDES